MYITLSDNSKMFNVKPSIAKICMHQKPTKYALKNLSIHICIH
jgi:hypothetical protein